MKIEFFSKAQENLKAAQLCFEHELYNACANRIYYAALQAAITALAGKNIKIEKIDHKIVQSEFSNRLIHKQKIYPAKFKSYLADMQTIRNIADYGTVQVSKAKASLWLARAKEMIESIEKEIIL